MTCTFLLAVVQKWPKRIVTPFPPFGTFFRKLLACLVNNVFVLNLHLLLCCQTSWLFWADFFLPYPWEKKSEQKLTNPKLFVQLDIRWYLISHINMSRVTTDNFKNAFLECWLQTGLHNAYNRMRMFLELKECFLRSYSWWSSSSCICYLSPIIFLTLHDSMKIPRMHYC